MRKIGKIFGLALGIVVILAAAYVIYMIVSYHRIPDNMELEIKPSAANAESRELKIGEKYRAVTYNIGFGAYTPEFSFFMDGGKYSWAESRESVEETVLGAASLVQTLEPDFAFFQEVDIDSTRSYHVNEYDLISERMDSYYSVFAQNYDSSFLAYPFLQPHGFCRAGLVLYSNYPITKAVRRSFPISTGISKFLDMDRCYSVSRIPVEGDKELVILNLHMSAYGNSDKIRAAQVRMLCEEMTAEYEAGNYVICGGDFNHDLLAEEEEKENKVSWAYPFPRNELPQAFSFCLDLLSQEEKESLWNSARNANMPYEEGVTYTVTLDGFIISDNIECVSYENIKTDYAYSDHEPVCLEFCLK